MNDLPVEQPINAAYVGLILRLLSDHDLTIWDLMEKTGIHQPVLFRMLCEMERQERIFAGFRKYHYSIHRSDGGF